MATEWVVEVPAERVVLTPQNRAEIVFTVTNVGTVPSRAVLDVMPGEGADRSWFTVDEPRRLLAAGASDAFRVTLAPPAGTPPGSFFVQARVYSDDVGVAPEEASRVSKRVQFDVPEPPAPRRRPWWPYALAAALALIVVIVLVFVLVGGGGDPDPNPTATPPATQPATSAPPTAGPPPTTGAPPTTAGPLRMPRVIGDPTQVAVDRLRSIGLSVQLQSVVDPTCNSLNQVMRQTPDPDTIVQPGQVVTIVVGQRPPPPRECP
jgi:hypothetical protein